MRGRSHQKCACEPVGTPTLVRETIQRADTWLSCPQHEVLTISTSGLEDNRSTGATNHVCHGEQKKHRNLTHQRAVNPGKMRANQRSQVSQNIRWRGRRRLCTRGSSLVVGQSAFTETSFMRDAHTPARWSDLSLHTHGPDSPVGREQETCGGLAASTEERSISAPMASAKSLSLCICEHLWLCAPQRTHAVHLIRICFPNHDLWISPPGTLSCRGKEPGGQRVRVANRSPALLSPLMDIPDIILAQGS